MDRLRASLPKLKEKLLEALKAVLLPIVGFVVALCFSVAPISPSILLCFLLGAVMIVAGMGTDAKSIVFSLPVTGAAGMRLLELAGDETDESAYMERT